MKKIGLTGNIGTGKSTIARIFEILGVPVYHADLRARIIMDSDEVKAKLIALFGSGMLLPDRNLNREALAEIVFNDALKLETLNRLIHPLVKTDFENWCKKYQTENFIIHEAAILFESGFHTLFDAVILVTAPEELCIARVMKRDEVNREMVLTRIKNQWKQEQKIKLAEYLIINDEESMVIPQVISLYNKLN